MNLGFRYRDLEEWMEDGSVMYEICYCYGEIGDVG